MYGRFQKRVINALKLHHCMNIQNTTPKTGVLIFSNNNNIYFYSAISIAVQWRFTTTITLKKINKMN